jgi:hypothetical protein
MASALKWCTKPFYYYKVTAKKALKTIGNGASSRQDHMYIKEAAL